MTNGASMKFDKQNFDKFTIFLLEKYYRKKDMKFDELLTIRLIRQNFPLQTYALYGAPTYLAIPAYLAVAHTIHILNCKME